MMLQETWDTGTGQRVQEVAPASDSGKDAQPEIDVDAWFAQREQAIEQLQARRVALLEEVYETDRRLAILGISAEEELLPEAPAQAPKARRAPPAKPRAKPQSKAKAKAKAKKGKSYPMGDKTSQILAVMSKTPEKITAIRTRVGMGYASAWRALDNARGRGLVRVVGTKGRDIRWALV